MALLSNSAVSTNPMQPRTRHHSTRPHSSARAAARATRCEEEVNEETGMTAHAQFHAAYGLTELVAPAPAFLPPRGPGRIDLSFPPVAGHERPSRGIHDRSSVVWEANLSLTAIECLRSEKRAARKPPAHGGHQVGHDEELEAEVVHQRVVGKSNRDGHVGSGSREGQ